jgi:predicted DCC family thiol-disulfide oxidoreductase YuxK
MRGWILYDKGCGLCNDIIKFVRTKVTNDHFRYIPHQSEEAKNIRIETGIDDFETDTVVYITEKGFFLRSTAVLHILKDIGGMWKLFFIFILIPNFIRDYFYRIIARNRYRWFRSKESC